jgi:hypothetical protein
MISLCMLDKGDSVMFDFLAEIFKFTFSKKNRLILLPFILVLLVFSIFIIAGQGTPWAPFVYAIF